MSVYTMCVDTGLHVLQRAHGTQMTSLGSSAPFEVRSVMFSAASSRLALMWISGDPLLSASPFLTWALRLQTCTTAPCPTLYGFWRFELRSSSLSEKHFIHWAIFSFHPRIGIASEGLPRAVVTLARLISVCQADRLKQAGYVLSSRGRILS